MEKQARRANIADAPASATGAALFAIRASTVQADMESIAPRSGVAFTLKRGEILRVIDPEGCQVADLLAYNASDTGEVLSSGRTLDYAETIRLTAGHK